MNINEIITLEPGKRGGKPCISGMRMTVYDVVSYLAADQTPGEILEANAFFLHRQERKNDPSIIIFFS